MKSRGVLPGRPKPFRDAVCVGEFNGIHFIAYVSGKAVIVIDTNGLLLQAVYMDSELKGIAFNEANGKFAVFSKDKVILLRENGYQNGIQKWAYETEFSIDPKDGCINAISWGFGGELLVGSNSLAIWTTGVEVGEKEGRPKMTWRSELCNPVELARFSHDGTLIASTGKNDRLVKIWRKVSFGVTDVQYDFSYLPHPRCITALHWSRPVHKDQTFENVLYTVCTDDVLRIWAPVHPHELYLLQIWNSIDLRSGQEPLGGENVCASERLFPFIVDNREFVLGVESAVKNSAQGSKMTDSLHHLTEIASRASEIIGVFTGDGVFTAWSVESVGARARRTTNITRIVTTKVGDFPLPLTGEAVLFFPYITSSKEGLNLILHYSSGKIFHFQTSLDNLLDVSMQSKRLHLKNSWSGLGAPVKRLFRDMEGTTLLSSSVANEQIVWRQIHSKFGTTLLRQSIIPADELVRRCLLLEDGKYALVLHQNSLVLYDASTPIARELEKVVFSIADKLICLLLLPEKDSDDGCYHVAAISTKWQGFAWEIRLPSDPKNRPDGTRSQHISTFGDLDLGFTDDLLMVLPVDPLGWAVKISGFLDKFARDVAVSVTKSGEVRTWAAKIPKEERKINWFCTNTVETGIESATLIKASSKGKLAIIDSTRKGLSIWNARSGQLEYQFFFEGQEEIQDLDWTCTPVNAQSILSVGFPHRVIMICQLRFDFIEKRDAWTAFREINIKPQTLHTIGDSVWLQNGSLAIGAGNQIFIYPRMIEESDRLLERLHLRSHHTKMNDLFEIVESLNGPLPVYHPQFLQQCITYGKNALVEKILARLYKELQNLHEEIPLDNFLNIPVDSFIFDKSPTPIRRGSLIGKFHTYGNDGEVDGFNQTTASGLGELLSQKAVPKLSGTEQRNLASIIESVAQVDVHRRSIDENAARFLTFFRLDMLHRAANPAIEYDISHREVAWAFHSESQEILVDLVNQSHNGQTLWKDLRQSGMAFWLKDVAALRRQFELIARNHYTSTELKNPVDCSLFYLALHKKVVLSGLWRLASWHREQAATLRLLANNFNEQRWKTAANKNAYALLSKHRYEYAAAFFLLADQLRDAVHVCLTKLKDPQLAIAVARCYEGDEGPVLRELLVDRILPLALKEGDRWLASWVFSMLKRTDLAVRALVSPLHTLTLDPSSSPPAETGLKTKLYLADDPALIILYRQIREKSIKAVKGDEKISLEDEFDFVLHTARINDRMGCDILALDLVKNWHFRQPPPVTRHSYSLDKKRERRRSSVKSNEGYRASGFGPPTPIVPPPQAFEEPDMSWMF